MANLKTSSVLTMGGVCLFAMPGLYTEILPRGGGPFGVWTKEGGGGGGRRVEAQWYHVRCYTQGEGKNDTRGGGGRRVEAQWYHVRCYTQGEGKNDTRGGPLNTAMHAIPFVPNSH